MEAAAQLVGVVRAVGAALALDHDTCCHHAGERRQTQDLPPAHRPTVRRCRRPPRSPPTRRSPRATTADIWLFRGRSIADRAIRVATNAPVNHVAMVVALDDLPPLLWHTELGRTLEDVWTGDAPSRRPAEPPRRCVRRVDRQVRPAGVRAPVHRHGDPADGGRAAARDRRLRRQAVPDDRAAWPGAGSSVASGRRRAARPSTAPS